MIMRQRRGIDKPINWLLSVLGSDLRAVLPNDYLDTIVMQLRCHEAVPSIGADDIIVSVVSDLG